MQKFKFALFVVPLVASLAAVAAENSSPAKSAQLMLGQLEGSWQMVGDVMGKAVEYRLTANRVLDGSFVELHMIDVQQPPRYEARVFLGADKNGKVFAHWLDSFGPGYSVPHGEGSVSADRIEILIPYKAGTFRDRFAHFPSSDEWTLEIDSEKSAGEWKHFASYRITRAAGKGEEQ